MKIFILSGLIFAIYASKSGAQTTKSDTIPHGLWKTQHTDTIPQGVWETVRIVNEKTVGGKTATSRYNSMADAKDLIRFPHVLEVIDSQTIALSFLGLEDKITAEYTVDGDRLTITEGAVGHTYVYSKTDGYLVFTLTYTYADYRTNRAAGQVELITEKWIFTLTHEK